MKKLVSMILSVATIFTFGMAVMAAEDLPSVTAGEGNVDVESAKDDNGNDITIIISEADPTEEELDALPDAVESAVDGAQVDALEIVDVEAITPDGVVNFPIKVTFIRNSADEVLAVLYWNEVTSTWDVADFTQNGKEVEVTFEHLCSVVFAIKESSNPNPNPAPTDPVSPQTGYSEILYIVAAVVLAGGAVFCFAKSRKQVAM